MTNLESLRYIVVKNIKFSVWERQENVSPAEYLYKLRV